MELTKQQQQNKKQKTEYQGKQLFFAIYENETTDQRIKMIFFIHLKFFVMTFP